MKRHLLTAWNPLYTRDVDQHFTLLLHWARLAQEGKALRYDPRTDTLTMLLRDNARIVESDENKPGIILDYDADGNLVSSEVLDASMRITEAGKVEFQTAE
ncbi:MAG: DUF2283 domain-containing protein [Gemmatimonadaceae bacterium]